MLWARIRFVVRDILHRRQFEETLSDELQFHIEQRAKDLMRRAGLPAEEALRRARVEFGSVEKSKEESRRAAGLRWIDELRTDGRYALRTFRKNPAFALAALATLALGIGANTTVFMAVDAALLKTLPVRHPSELVAFGWIRTPRSMFASYDGSGRIDRATGQEVRTSFSLLTFERVAAQNQTLSGVTAFASRSPVNVVDDRQADIASNLLVSGDFFSVLGVSAIRGRTLTRPDDKADAALVAMISHRYWRRRFGGDETIVGKTVRLNGVAASIVGVASAEFFGIRAGTAPDIFIPLAHEQTLNSSDQETGAWSWRVQMMARRKPGVTTQQVSTDLARIFPQSVREAWESRPAQLRGERFVERTEIPQLRVTPGDQGPDGPPGSAARTLPILFAIVALILLIVCANLANLFLARASSRAHEVAVRFSLGASRKRLVRQLLTESVLLSLSGGLLGVVIANWGTGFLTLIPATNSLIFDTGIGLRVLGFAGGLSLLTGLLFGIAPALRATTVCPGSTLRTSSGTVSRNLLPKSLLILQVSVCLVLLIGAGLYIATLRNLARVDLGFNPKDLILFSVNPQFKPAETARITLFYDEALNHLRRIPGVESASISSVRPLSGSNWDGDVTPDDDSTTTSMNSSIQVVSDTFLETMQIPLVAGRSLESGDNEGSPKVVIVNEAFAKAMFPGVNALGRRIRFADPVEVCPCEIVGIVRDARYSDLLSQMPATMYLPFRQNVQPPMTFEVRVNTPAGTVIPAMRQAIQQVDRNLPLARIQTQVEQIAATVRSQRMFAIFSGTFSAVALLLASIGLYGVVSYGVTGRTKEIGLRVALGAQRRNVIWLVIRETLAVVSIGIGIGLAAAAGLKQFIEGELYGIAPNDASTIITAMAVLMTVATVAASLPGFRASRIDPAVALRVE